MPSCGQQSWQLLHLLVSHLSEFSAHLFVYYPVLLALSLSVEQNVLHMSERRICREAGVAWETESVSVFAAPHAHQSGASIWEMHQSWQPEQLD